MPTRPLIPLLLLSAACSVATEAGEALPLDFRSVPYEQVQRFAAEGGDGVIIVRDRTITGVCHREESQSARLENSTVTLRIEHAREEDAEPCIALGKLGAYVATIGGLAPGAYRLRAEYVGEIHTETYPRPQLEETVVVR